MAETNDGIAPPARPCPICGKPAVARLRPFCSARCADIDLGRWLKATYVIPGEALDETQVVSPAPAARDEAD